MSKETNAERLERIKHNTGGIYCMESESVESKDVPVEDFDWLIEQAEENACQKKMLLHLYRYTGMSAEYDAKLWKELETFLGGRGAARKALEGEG